MAADEMGVMSDEGMRDRVTMPAKWLTPTRGASPVISSLSYVIFRAWLEAAIATWGSSCSTIQPQRSPSHTASAMSDQQLNTLPLHETLNLYISPTAYIFEPSSSSVTHDSSAFVNEKDVRETLFVDRRTGRMALNGMTTSNTSKRSSRGVQSRRTSRTPKRRSSRAMESWACSPSQLVSSRTSPVGTRS